MKITKELAKQIKAEAFNEGSGTYCNRGEVIEELARLALRALEHEENIEYLLNSTPGAIRVCEGGGPEDLAHSLAVTFIKLRDRL